MANMSPLCITLGMAVDYITICRKFRSQPPLVVWNIERHYLRLELDLGLPLCAGDCIEEFEAFLKNVLTNTGFDLDFDGGDNGGARGVDLDLGWEIPCMVPRFLAESRHEHISAALCRDSNRLVGNPLAWEGLGLDPNPYDCHRLCLACVPVGV